MTNPDSQLDLVICADHNFSFDNRWRFSNDPIDYGTVQIWNQISRSDSQLRKANAKLKRIKIYRLAWKPMANLLGQLFVTTQLEQLEIDTWQLHRDSHNQFGFNFLKRFAVDSVKIVDKYGLEIGGTTNLIRLSDNLADGNPHKFEHLYFGRC